MHLYRILFALLPALCISCSNRGKHASASSKQDDTSKLMYSYPVDGKAKTDVLPLKKPYTDTQTPFENFTVNLNSDTLIDTIFLRYDKIKIHLAGGPSKEFSPHNEWRSFDTSGFFTIKKNLVPTNEFFLFRYQKNMFLVLFGIYLSGQDYSVIKITDNDIKMVLDRNMGITYKLTDYDKDGRLDLFSQNYGEVWNNEKQDSFFSSYDPTYIYSLDSTFKLNLSLTEKYNKENYCWAGLDNPQGLKLYHPGGLDSKKKPYLVK